MKSSTINSRHYQLWQQANALVFAVAAQTQGDRCDLLQRLSERSARRYRALAAQDKAFRPIPASWVLVPCESCDGEGYIEQAVPGGYFDARQECFYPLERLVKCHRCQGQGAVKVTFDVDHELRRAA